MTFEQIERCHKAMSEIAGGEKRIRKTFDDSLAGDVARFRLLRELRRVHTLEVCEELIEGMATR